MSGRGTSTWTAAELERIGGAEEIEIAPDESDGSPRDSVTIWVVRHEDDLYVRSFRGAGSGWYRASKASHQGRIEVGDLQRKVDFEDIGHALDPQVDAAYSDKYGRYGDLVDQMVTPEVQETTIRIVPRSA